MKSGLVTAILAVALLLPFAGHAISHSHAELDHSAAPPPPKRVSNKGPLKHEQVVVVRGTVLAVDAKTRLVMLKTEGGPTIDVQAGDEVKNLDEISVGDSIEATYTESVVYQIVQKGEPQGSASQKVDSITGSARINQEVTYSFEVASVDPATNTIWVALTDGTTRPISFDERSHKRLMALMPGSVVLATYTASAARRLDKLAGPGRQ